MNGTVFFYNNNYSTTIYRDRYFCELVLIGRNWALVKTSPFKVNTNLDAKFVKNRRWRKVAVHWNFMFFRRRSNFFQIYFGVWNCFVVADGLYIPKKSIEKFVAEYQNVSTFCTKTNYLIKFWQIRLNVSKIIYLQATLFETSKNKL